MTMPGPGDAATWPRSTNHPNDPRNDGGMEDEMVLARLDSSTWTEECEECGEGFVESALVDPEVIDFSGESSGGYWEWEATVRGACPKCGEQTTVGLGADNLP